MKKMLALAAIAAFSLSACGGNSSEESADNQAASGSSYRTVWTQKVRMPDGTYESCVFISTTNGAGVACNFTPKGAE